MPIKNYFPLDVDTSFEIQESAGLTWPIVRALDDIATELGASREHALYAALAIVLQRTTGKNELCGRLSIDGHDVMRTFIPAECSLPEAIAVVRDAEIDELHRVAAMHDDPLCTLVFGRAGCQLNGVSRCDEFRLTLSSREANLGKQSRAVLDALITLVTIEVARPTEHFPAFRPRTL